jgi:hypothetical protein
MSHENSQFEIPAIQLRESRTQPKVSLSREIGEAQITHTLFGRAKVRIIRKGDQARRNMMLAAIVVVLAVAAWQGWLTLQQTEQTQNVAPAPGASTGAQASLPASQPESTVSPAIPPAVKSEPVTPLASEISAPAASRKSVPQQAGNLKEAGQKPTVPAKAQPKPVMIKPKAISPVPMIAPQQPAPVAISKDVLKNQTDMPPAREMPAKRAVTPAVPPVQPAASSPVVAVPPGKEEITIQSPIGDKQLSAPINAPGK